ncbi:unnamed protein product [Leuciscus chuanchicus]
MAERRQTEKLRPLSLSGTSVITKGHGNETATPSMLQNGSLLAVVNEELYSSLAEDKCDSAQCCLTSPIWEKLPAVSRALLGEIDVLSEPACLGLNLCPKPNDPREVRGQTTAVAFPLPIPQHSLMKPEQGQRRADTEPKLPLGSLTEAFHVLHKTALWTT